MECFHTLETFGIPSNQFPLNLVTGKVCVARNIEWLELQAAMEHGIELPTKHTFIESPKASDILFGRGAIISKHPGNLAFRNYVKANLDTYAGLQTKNDRWELTRDVTLTLKNNYGIRFLKEDRKGDTNCMGWVEASDETARTKVRIAFRDAIKIRREKCAKLQSKIRGDREPRTPSLLDPGNNVASRTLDHHP